MALFGFGKKKDEEKNVPACACQSGCATFEATEEDANKVKIEDGAMSVKVLGVGCASCHEQYEQAKAAVKSMGLDVEVEYSDSEVPAWSIEYSRTLGHTHSIGCAVCRYSTCRGDVDALPYC